jgi:hypothetical protein
MLSLLIYWSSLPLILSFLFSLTEQVIKLWFIILLSKHPIDMCIYYRRHKHTYFEYSPNDTVFVMPCYRRKGCHWPHLQQLSCSWSWQSSWWAWHSNLHMPGLWWALHCSCSSHCAATVLVKRHIGSAQTFVLIPSAQSQRDVTTVGG